MKLLNRFFKKSNKKDISTEHKVNPVYDTAIACLCNLAYSGCKEAEALKTALNFTSTPSPMVQDGLSLMQEIRYEFINKCITDAKIMDVMDLGCGYCPRPIRLAPLEYTYIGCDLPAVIKSIEPAAKNLIPESFRYKAVYMPIDATNQESVLKAANRFQGPITMVADGLFMYFSVFELEAFLKSVKRILKEHGGALYTPDFNTLKLIRVCVGSKAGDWLTDVTASVVSKMAKDYSVQSNDEMDSSSWFAQDSDEIPYNFFKNMGFTVERIPMYTEEMQINAFSLLNDEAVNEAKEGLKDVYGWKISLEEQEIEKEVRSKGYNARFSQMHEDIYVKVSGRLDTLAAPSFLEDFEEADTDRQTAKTVFIDMEDLEYISSSGLRTLLLIRKKEDVKKIEILGANDFIKEVLSSTGFEDALK